jgi:hypothetical protein
MSNNLFNYRKPVFNYLRVFKLLSNNSGILF